MLLQNKIFNCSFYAFFTNWWGGHWGKVMLKNASDRVPMSLDRSSLGRGGTEVEFQEEIKIPLKLRSCRCYYTLPRGPADREGCRKGQRERSCEEIYPNPVLAFVMSCSLNLSKQNFTESFITCHMQDLNFSAHSSDFDITVVRPFMDFKDCERLFLLCLASYWKMLLCRSWTYAGTWHMHFSNCWRNGVQEAVFCRGWQLSSTPLYEVRAGRDPINTKESHVS